MSKVCDLCNASTDVDYNRVYSPSVFRSMADRGLQPDESTLRMMISMGFPGKEEALQYWKTYTVGVASTDWLLCPACAQRAVPFQ